MEKYNNNNTDRDKFENIVQLDLNGKMQSTKGKTKLRGYHKYFLETFYENREIAITKTNLYNAWGSELGIHENTIKNFINTALSRGWIYKMKAIEGTRVSNAYFDIKQPDYLSTGQIVDDKRFKYYRITRLGIKIFEGNGLNLTQNKLL